MKNGYVYILSSQTRRLYIGVTSDLEGRGWEHKNGAIEGFTKTYKINQLVYYEDYPDALQRDFTGEATRRIGAARRTDRAHLEK